MATFQFNGKQIYYEVHGEGKPLLILNGIMMSTLSWKVFVPSLSEHNQLILVDFLDQGASEKLEETYTQDIQVEVVKSLLDELKIDQVNLFGISYGGEVALKFALKYQKHIEKLLLFNTTAYTSPWLEDIGRAWIKTAQTYDAEAYYKVAIPVIYSPMFYTKRIDWMKNREQVLKNVFTKPFLDSMNRLTLSAEGHDVRDQLHKISVPTLIVGSEQDYMTPLEDQKLINREIETSELVILPNCGHASMYEKPWLFLSLVLGFVNSDINVKI